MRSLCTAIILCLLGCAVPDTCPVEGGVAWGGKRRFMYGVNYAGHHFGANFGGASSLNQKGVSGNPSIERELADMKERGADTIRWWIFPDFRGDGVVFDSQGTYTH